jgi:Fur family transcriptional regulator, peroxide stress response regulator
MIPIMKRPPSPQQIEADITKGLQDKGYKLTSQRREIIRMLAKDTSHPSAMEILKKVRKSLPKVSTSTVYYTLDMLKSEGLIREIEFYDRDNRYDVNVKNHINLICQKCGTIQDFRAEIPLSYDQVMERMHFQPVDMRYEYYGYCKKCMRKKT